MRIERKIEIASERLADAIEKHQPIAVFGLFSGGHDSFSATYIASLHPAFTSAVHINTGWGIEATREYVRDVSNAREWKLLEYRASENVRAKTGEPDPQSFEDYVRINGFPGPAGHRWVYARLKERQLRRLERDCGASSPKHRLMYVSGARTEESDRRMGNTEEVQIDGRRIWCAPIHDWTKLDTTDLLEYAKQHRNPVVDLIHKSGECLCGAFAKPGELEELELWDITRPMYHRIKALEAEVVPIFGRGWGERPDRDKWSERLFEPTEQSPWKAPLCWGCDKL